MTGIEPLARKVRNGCRRTVKALRERDVRSRYNAYLFELRNAVEGCATLLDLGCGPHSPMSAMGWEFSVGVEGFPAMADKAEAAGTHSRIVRADLREIGRIFAPGSFDAVVALDVIEHLEKEQGRLFLREMERIACKAVVVSTPNGFLPQPADDNVLQEHLSGWSCGEFLSSGYEVTGLFGLKVLRGIYHEPRFRPKLFWGLAAEFSQLIYARSHPRHAAGLICVKRITTSQDVTL